MVAVKVHDDVRRVLTTVEIDETKVVAMGTPVKLYHDPARGDGGFFECVQVWVDGGQYFFVHVDDLEALRHAMGGVKP